MKQLTTILHSLFCRLNHLNCMEELRLETNNPEVCLFYLEQVFEEPWLQRDHLVWLGNADELVKLLAVSSPEEATRLLSKALNIAKLAAPVVSEHPQLRRVIINLIELA